MFKRLNRLTKDKNFKTVFRKGRGLKSQQISIKWLRSPAPPKVGVVVGTRVSKKAVLRNRVKRQLREIIRKELPTFSKPVWLVVIAEPDIKELSFLEKKEVLTKLFQKAHLYN